MVHELLYTIVAVILVSLISLIGVLTFFFRKNSLEKNLFMLVAFAAGTLLATAFFDLVPESFESLGSITFVLIGLLLFFLLESFIHWHHHHGGECEQCIQPVVYTNLVADGIHNFLDGLIIAASFLTSIPSGIAVTIAIALHEIPQEIGDFAVLVHGGIKKTNALVFNFLSASLAIMGGITGYLFLSELKNLIPYFIAIAAGGFLYIATSDLFPELHKEKDYRKIILQIFFLILGIVLIGVLLTIFPE